MGFTTVDNAPDVKFNKVTSYWLASGSNVEVSIPLKTIGFHYFPVGFTAVTYFKLNGSGSMVIPSNATQITGGFLGTAEGRRILYEAPCATSTDKLNLVNSTSGSMVIEFFGHTE